MRPSDVTDAPEGTTGATMDPNVDATNAFLPSSDSIRGEPVPNSIREADWCGRRDPKTKPLGTSPQGPVSSLLYFVFKRLCEALFTILYENRVENNDLNFKTLILFLRSDFRIL